MNITVTPSGQIEFIYADSLAGLRDLGRCRIRRASFVEPNKEGRWVADLSPVDGPGLGPFDLRREALEAERQWLERNLLKTEGSA